MTFTVIGSLQRLFAHAIRRSRAKRERDENYGAFRHFISGRYAGTWNAFPGEVSMEGSK